MEKLLALITILQRANGGRLLARLFSQMAIIMALVLVTAMMISATLIGGLIHAHAAFLNGGMSPFSSLIIIVASALLIITLLISVIAWRLQRLQQMSRTLFGKSPLTRRAVDTLDAFIDGLTAE